jgi:ribosomal protein S27E
MLLLLPPASQFLTETSASASAKHDFMLVLCRCVHLTSCSWAHAQHAVMKKLCASTLLSLISFPMAAHSFFLVEPTRCLRT